MINRPKAIVRVDSHMEPFNVDVNFNIGKRYLTVNDIRYSLVEAGGIWDKGGVLATRIDRFTIIKVLPIETEQGTRLARQYLQKRIAHRMKDDIKILDILGVDTK